MLALLLIASPLPFLAAAAAGTRPDEDVTASPPGVPPGRAMRDLFGASVASVPDLDGGGKTDLAIGDPAWTDSSRDRGRVWLVSTETGRAIRVLEPDLPHRGFGWTLERLGDVNAGGRPDLAVGAMRWKGWASGDDQALVYVYALEDHSLVRRHESKSEEFLWAWDSFGGSPRCADVGDWDGDACADYAIGHPLASLEPGLGAVEFVSGRTGTTIFTWKDPLPPKDGETNRRFAQVLCALPDSDGDGKMDLAASHLPIGSGGTEETTGVVVVLGSRTRELLSTLRPRRPSSWYGSSMAWVGAAEAREPAELWIAEPYAFHTHPAEPPAFESWSTGDWKRTSRHSAPRSTAGNATSHWGCVLVPVRDADDHGTPGILVTAAETWDSECAILGRSGWILEGSGIDGKEEASYVGSSATQVDDVDGDGARDFAFGGVTTRGALTGVVVIWSRAKRQVIRELTLASCRAPAPTAPK